MRELKGDNIATLTADFQQGMESVFYLKMKAVTENYWVINAADNGDLIMWGIILSR